MCLAVNHIFGTSLVSARDDVKKIDVRKSSIWSAYESLKDVLQQEESVLLLTTGGAAVRCARC